MDQAKQKILAKVKELISEAEIGQAIDLLQEFLLQDGKYSNLYNISVQIEAFLKKTKRDELKAIISFENAKLNYNQVNDQFLKLIESLEKGELNPKSIDDLPQFHTKNAGNRKNLIIAALVFLVVVSGFALWKLTSGEAMNTCPTFEKDSKFDILILPFTDPSGDKAAQPEITIQQRLSQLSLDKRVNASVEIFSNFLGEDAGIPSYPEAGEIGKGCNANLIIWGLVEQNLAEGGFDIITNFKFLGKEDFFELNQIKLEGANQANNLKTLSKIATQGQLTQNIEEAILLVFGIMSREQGNHKAAIASLENINSSDSATAFVSNILLADSFIEENEPEKASKALDSVIQVKPDYWLALNNKAMLSLTTNSPLEALDDFTAAMKIRKNDPELYHGKAEAYKQTEQWKQAEITLEKAAELAPENESFQQDLKEVKEMIANEEKKIRKSRTRPQTSSSINEVTRSYYRTGNAAQAERNINRSNEQDAAVYGQRIIYLISNEKYDAAKKAIEDAERKGIKKEEIFRTSPSIEKYYNRRLEKNIKSKTQ